MSHRWNYKVVELTPKLFGDTAARIETALQSLGLLGWELVSVTQASSMDRIRLFLKKPA